MGFKIKKMYDFIKNLSSYSSPLSTGASISKYVYDKAINKAADTLNSWDSAGNQTGVSSSGVQYGSGIDTAKIHNAYKQALQDTSSSAVSSRPTQGTEALSSSLDTAINSTNSGNYKYAVGSGSPGGLAARNNNPLNLKFAGQKGASLGEGDFAKFNSFEDGWNAGVNQLSLATSGRSSVYNPQMSLYEFYSKYAPASDNNNPVGYANYIADKLGVDPKAPIGQLRGREQEWAKWGASMEDSNYYHAMFGGAGQGGTTQGGTTQTGTPSNTQSSGTSTNGTTTNNQTSTQTNNPQRVDFSQLYPTSTPIVPFEQTPEYQTISKNKDDAISSLNSLLGQVDANTAQELNSINTVLNNNIELQKIANDSYLGHIAEGMAKEGSGGGLGIVSPSQASGIYNDALVKNTLLIANLQANAAQLTKQAQDASLKQKMEIFGKINDIKTQYPKIVADMKQTALKYQNDMETYYQSQVSPFVPSLISTLKTLGSTEEKQAYLQSFASKIGVPYNTLARVVQSTTSENDNAIKKYMLDVAKTYPGVLTPEMLANGDVNAFNSALMSNPKYASEINSKNAAAYKVGLPVVNMISSMTGDPVIADNMITISNDILDKYGSDASVQNGALQLLNHVDPKLVMSSFGRTTEEKQKFRAAQLLAAKQDPSYNAQNVLFDIKANSQAMVDLQKRETRLSIIQNTLLNSKQMVLNLAKETNTSVPLINVPWNAIKTKLGNVKTSDYQTRFQTFTSEISNMESAIANSQGATEGLRNSVIDAFEKGATYDQWVDIFNQIEGISKNEKDAIEKTKKDTYFDNKYSLGADGRIIKTQTPTSNSSVESTNKTLAEFNL